MRLPLPLVNFLIRTFEKRSLQRITDTTQGRRRLERLARFLFVAPPFARFDRCTVGEGEQKIPAIRASGGAENRSGRTIFYIHGGAHFMGSARTHQKMLAHLAMRIEGEAILPDYALAPEHPFPKALEQLKSGYRDIINKGQDPKKLIIGGDSSGAGLAFALLAEILKEGLPAPSCIFGLCGWYDLTLEAESLTTMCATEVMLPHDRVSEARDAYVGDQDPSDPRISPLFADFTGGPPVLLHVASHELLRDDTLNMQNHLLRQNLDVTCRIFDNAPHVWHILAGLLAEANDALDDLAEFIRSHS